MRKIMNTMTLNAESFEPYHVIKVRDENGVVTELLNEKFEKINKYTLAEIHKIDECNEALKKHDMPEMTEEEIEYMIDPYGMKRTEKMSEEEIQRLAGFKVEKTVKYFDDLHSEENT